MPPVVMYGAMRCVMSMAGCLRYVITTDSGLILCCRRRETSISIPEVNG